MFYVLQSPRNNQDQAIALRSGVRSLNQDAISLNESAEPDADDIDFVDDAILNIAPHNPIERQLLTGDVIGLALMSGAIIWTAMGAIA